MDESMSEKNMNKTLLQEVDGGKLSDEEVVSRQQRQLEKEEERRWVPIARELSLAEALARLNKQELTDIRIQLNVKGASSLNKQQLADKLSEEILLRMPETLESFDEERYQLAKSAADRRGVHPALNDAYRENYMQSCGLLFPGMLDGERMLVMPREAADRFRELDSAALRGAVRANTQAARLVQGMLAYYGVLRADSLPERLAPYVKEVPPLPQLEKLLRERAAFAGGFQLLDYGYADEAAFDAEQLLEEHEARPEIPYYRFTTEQLLQAAVPDFVERNISYRSFVRYIVTNYEMSEEDADDVVMGLVLDIQNGTPPSELLESLQDQFEMTDEAMAAGFIAHLTALNNNTRLWALKGHSPSGLSALLGQGGPSGGTSGGAIPSGAGGKVVPIAAGRKVGRNEPCPCGSGKKYKKCCGAND